MNLPESFLNRMKDLLGDDFEAYRDSFSKEGYGQTLRVNPFRTKPADLIRRFLCDGTEPVAWCPEGLYYRGEIRLSRHPLYYGGVYYLQEPSAMAPAAFLPVKPGDRVLDLCAAPGGKSTALAGKLEGRGILVANDISVSRSRALLKNLEMAGVPNTIVTCESPAKLAAAWPGYFDAVLVDAPCSGEGMFRKDVTMSADWSREEVGRYAALQREILAEAFAMLAPGGYLLYSTCTYAPEEDEENVWYFLNKMPDLDLLALPSFEGVEEGRPEWLPETCSSSDPDRLRRCRRFLPHKVEGEGQFAALFYRKQEGEERRESKVGAGDPVGKDLAGQIEHFLQGIPTPGILGESRDWRSRIKIVKEGVFLLPEVCPDFRGIRTMRSGLHLGEWKRNRFTPSQALAMVLDPDSYENSLTLAAEDERVLRYLRGETLELTDQEGGHEGWTLVCLEEFPLGWGKGNRGRLKNKYRPGWRMQ